MTLSSRHGGSHAPSRLTFLERENKTLHAEIERLKAELQEKNFEVVKLINIIGEFRDRTLGQENKDALRRSKRVAKRP
jgi:hypothetical protein